MTMNRYYWTNKEVAVVNAHYPTGGVKACLPLLPRRTKGAIYQQDAKLGLVERKAPRGSWPATEEVDRMIVECYRNHPEKGALRKLAKRVNRPYWWVKKRGANLGVAKLALAENKEAEWSTAEIELLEKHAHKQPEIIARAFRANGHARTATAIAVKRKRLQFNALDIDHYTATQLAGEFGVDIKVVTRWIDQGWLVAGRRGTKRTAIQGGDHWWIKRKHVRDFVIGSIGIIDIRKVDKVWLVDLLAN
jgi:hypothetical protein